MFITGAGRGIALAVNALWPRTALITAAVQNLPGGDRATQISRTPAIMADAAHAILTSPSRDFTGRFCIDDLVLRDAGVTDFTQYRVTPESDTLLADFFVPDDVDENPGGEKLLMMEPPEH
ncbi:MAG: hypothetical protein HKO62_00115 [Gammaproteobacteria bacterium]|nr:hypothetical protein [Gammaproteobacteria bacterium]